MNKLAKKLKERRRKERFEQKQEEMRELTERFNKYQKSVGKSTDIPPEVIYKKYREIERDYTVRATMLTAMAAMYALNVNHGFGYKRLYEYAVRLTHFIHAIDSGDRTMEQLKGEILEETGVNAAELGEVQAPAEQEMLYRCCSGALVMTLYHMYYDRGWKNIRLRRLYHEIVDVLRDVILNGKDLEIRRFLLKKFGVSFMDDGHVQFEMEEQ